MMKLPDALGAQLGNLKKMSENEATNQEFKMSKTINNMDDELKDRFKALKMIQDDCHEIDEEEMKEMRKLEIEFEEKYKEIYALRE